MAVKNMDDNMYRENHVSAITLQYGFVYNTVAPPGPKTLWYMEGAVYADCK